MSLNVKYWDSTNAYTVSAILAEVLKLNREMGRGWSHGILTWFEGYIMSGGDRKNSLRTSVGVSKKCKGKK